MPQYAPLTEQDIQEKIKALQERVVQMRRRKQMVGELKKWMERRKLLPSDVQFMVRQMKPKRAAKPVTSKKPLQPVLGRAFKSGVKRRGDPEFMRAVREARMDMKLTSEEVGKRIGASHASVTNWETGRYIPKEEARVKILKVLNLPMHLGAEATKMMMAEMGNRPNGRGAA